MFKLTTPGIENESLEICLKHKWQDLNNRVNNCNPQNQHETTITYQQQ